MIPTIDVGTIANATELVFTAEQDDRRYILQPKVDGGFYGLARPVGRAMMTRHYSALGLFSAGALLSAALFAFVAVAWHMGTVALAPAPPCNHASPLFHCETDYECYGKGGYELPNQ